MVPYVTITEWLNNVTNALDVASFPAFTLPSFCPLIPHQQFAMQPKWSKKIAKPLILSSHCLKPFSAFPLLWEKVQIFLNALGSPSGSHALLASLASVSPQPPSPTLFFTATSVNTSKSIMFSLLYLFALTRPVFPTSHPCSPPFSHLFCLTPIFHKVQAYTSFSLASLPWFSPTLAPITFHSIIYYVSLSSIRW